MSSHHPRRTTAARNAVAVVFGVNGFAMATWASRLPAIRSDLDLSTQRLGLVLVALSATSVLTLTVAGAVVRRLGPAATVTVCVLIGMAGMTVMGLAEHVWMLALGLAMLGVGVGAWDVAMNVEGAEVERRLERSIMPRFHAAFSLGTIGGAGVGALAALVDLPVRAHLIGVAVVVAVAGVVAVRSFLPAGVAPSDSPADDAGGLRAAWMDPRTLVIGLFVLGMALAEGSANDWIALSLVDGYGAPQALGAVALGVFVTGMTTARMLGTAALNRFDHVVVARASALLVLVGTGLIVIGAILADGSAGPLLYLLAAVAALLWGLGAALGFPMGMSAAAADSRNAAARVGVVSTVGYTAFLAGPPLLGTLGHAIGTAQSMIAVTVAVVLALLTAPAIRPARPADL